MDRDERVGPVVFAGQKLPELEFVELMNQPGVFGGNLPIRLSPSCLIRFFRCELVELPVPSARALDARVAYVAGY